MNLAGGMKLGEPAIDLGIIMAIASSYRDRPILEDTIIFGEVGLVGEAKSRIRWRSKDQRSTETRI